MRKILIMLWVFLPACSADHAPNGDIIEDSQEEPETLATDLMSADSEVNASADFGLAPEDTTLIVEDSTTTEPDWNWTWLQCRLAFINEELSGENETLCTHYYSTPTDTHRFGIRWIFLGHDEETVATYPESQMGDLNDIYAPQGMEFFIHSRLRIEAPVATEGATGETKFPVSALVGDIRQYLESDEEDPQAVVDLLLSTLESKGVQTAEKNGGDSPGPKPRATETDLDTEWSSYDLHGRVSRLNNELITVVVRQASGEKSWGNYPRAGNIAPVAGLIYLASPTALSALPHEMGHYFGLPHTQGLWNKKPGSTQEWQAGTILGLEDEDFARVQALAGDDYNGDFKSIYVHFNSDSDVIDDFERGQILSRKVLGWSELTYVGDFFPVTDDSEFIALIRDGTPPLMKNFVRDNEGGSFSGNNCGKSYVGDDQTTLKCKYGDNGDDPLHILYGDAPILFDSVLFAEGVGANMMSYINTDTSDGVRRKKYLTTRQWDLIRLGTRMPSRMRLRNYALFD